MIARAKFGFWLAVQILQSSVWFGSIFVHSQEYKLKINYIILEIDIKEEIEGQWSQFSWYLQFLSFQLGSTRGLILIITISYFNPWELRWFHDSPFEWSSRTKISVYMSLKCIFKRCKFRVYVSVLCELNTDDVSFISGKSRIFYVRPTWFLEIWIFIFCYF